MAKIEKLVWDEWNVEHVSRHDVHPTEVETALKDPKKIFLPTYNDRALLLGRSKERLLTVVLSEEYKNNYYVVTARDMSKKERRRYRNEE